MAYTGRTLRPPSWEPSMVGSATRAIGYESSLSDPDLASRGCLEKKRLEANPVESGNARNRPEVPRRGLPCPGRATRALRTRHVAGPRRLATPEEGPPRELLGHE